MNCGHEFHMSCLVQWLQKPDGTGNCPYCRAAPSEKERLVAAPVDSESEDEESDDDEEGAEVSNVTALMNAACHGDIDEVMRLLEQGEVVDAKDSDGDTALVYAMANGEDSSADALLTAGADILLISKLYESSHEAELPPSIGLALLAACQCNSVPGVAAALAAGADPNFAHPTTGITALMEAISNDGPCANVDLLLSRGASVFAVDIDGWNVFMWFAEKCADTDIMASLLGAAGSAFNPMPAAKLMAAKKIQALWRGHAVRALIKTEQSVAHVLTDLRLSMTIDC